MLDLTLRDDELFVSAELPALTSIRRHVQGNPLLLENRAVALATLSPSLERAGGRVVTSEPKLVVSLNGTHYALSPLDDDKTPDVATALWDLYDKGQALFSRVPTDRALH